MLLWKATADDLKTEVLRLREERDHERRRAEALENMLLAKTQGMVLRPDELKSAEKIEEQAQKNMDMFDESSIFKAAQEIIGGGLI